jgi:hypothetical protein
VPTTDKSAKYDKQNDQFWQPAPPAFLMNARKQQEGELGLKERWYPIQVKQKDKAGRPDIDAFGAMMMREDCEKGFFVSFDYSSDALQEIESFFKRSHKVIVALTVQEILDEHIAKKLA